ncbi:pectin acetylesterase 8-like isoform X1 [Nicotiana tabacum]|uniref:Pectin acetylesterase 8-like isoform X1 n=1 Tax=Nicotiana tabacum TaxID=4097 RepID=A0AC58SP12_TOBAC|nr:pectin acetylesterase 8-like isoform X1 [Nicotiana tomentosiformis]
MRRSMEHTKLQCLCLLIFSLLVLNGKTVLGVNQTSNENLGMVDLTILESAVSKGAVCLDGSPPAFYYDKGHGEGANNWIIYFRGGEWCYNVIDCLNRTKTEKGSSKLAPKQRSFYGILSNNKTLNPDFYNWNRVMVIYCDGASFTGDVEIVDPVTNLHFRGARIFHALIEHFLAKGMKDAKNAILAGGSAGGLPALLHCDRFRALLPNSARVKCLADGSYFLHKKNMKEIPFMDIVNEGLITLHHSAKMLPSSCISKMRPSLCLFPQYFQQEIQTPFFIVNSMFDTFQINKTFLGYYEDLNNNTCSATLVKTLQDFKQEFLSALPKQSDCSSSRGMFIDSCLIHSQILSGVGWNGFTVHNKTIAEAFSDWYFDRSSVQLIDTPDLPLNCYKFPSITSFCT